MQYPGAEKGKERLRNFDYYLECELPSWSHSISACERGVQPGATHRNHKRGNRRWVGSNRDAGCASRRGSAAGVRCNRKCP